jgi:hypothetical protein
MAGQDILSFLEERIMEWELDRDEARISHEREMSKIKRMVEKIKATNCKPCE